MNYQLNIQWSNEGIIMDENIELTTGWEQNPKKGMCDGCGWEEKIVFVDYYGKRFCLNCMHEGY